MEKIKLKKGREFNVTNRHPWIFSGALAANPTHLPDGTFVHIEDIDGTHLGTGHYFNKSIAIKVTSFKNEPLIDEVSLLTQRIEAALNLRKTLISEKSANAYRLFNAEGDFFPGLIIDAYSNTFVIEPHSSAIERLFPDITIILKKLFPNSEIICKGAHNPEEKETKIYENNIQYFVNVTSGQKTGFFLDQRDNRKIVQEISQDKSVLNTFSYTGGFSLNALQGGASKVVSVDSSASALELLERNLTLNSFDSQKHTSVKLDCFDYLGEEKNCYDVVILDPPALAKIKDAKKNALKAYERLTAAGVRRCNKNGILFTFSCSGHVSDTEFYDTVENACKNAERNIRILKTLGPGVDHPTSIFHNEGRYLKGLMLLVE